MFDDSKLVEFSNLKEDMKITKREIDNLGASVHWNYYSVATIKDEKLFITGGEFNENAPATQKAVEYNLKNNTKTDLS